MTWTYDDTQLGTSELFQIRLEVADTDVNDQLLQDQEIARAQSQERDFWGACARCAEMISRGFLRKADVKLGRSMQIVYTKAAQQWAEMAVALRRKSLGTVAPYFGGVNLTDKIAIATNAGLASPAFTRNEFVNPWVGGYTPDTVGLSPGGVTEEAYPSPSVFT